MSSEEVCINIETIGKTQAEQIKVAASEAITVEEVAPIQTRMELLASLKIVETILNSYCTLTNEEYLERKEKDNINPGSFTLVSINLKEDADFVDPSFGDYGVTTQEIFDAFKTDALITKTIVNPDTEFNGWTVHSVVEESVLKIVLSKVAPVQSSWFSCVIC